MKIIKTIMGIIKSKFACEYKSIYYQLKKLLKTKEILDSKQSRRKTMIKDQVLGI